MLEEFRLLKLPSVNPTDETGQAAHELGTGSRPVPNCENWMGGGIYPLVSV